MFPTDLTIIFCVILSSATATTFKDCGSNVATVSSVDVLNCPDGTIPCPFKRGTNVTMSITITPSIETNKVALNIYGIIAGIKTPFQTNIDACGNKLIDCPTKPGTSLTFTDSVFVEKVYPKVRLIADVELTTDDGKFLTCVQLPAEIVD